MLIHLDYRGTSNGGDIFINPGDYAPSSSTQVQGAEKLKAIGIKMLKILNSIATVLSVIIFSVLGVKYMLGSVEEKADYKKNLVPYVIGAILVFGITRIVSIISTFAKNI